MKTIKSFNLSPLHVEEDFGFLKQFHDEAVTLRGGSGGDSESPDEIADDVNPVLDNQISAFETKLDAFDEALKSSSSLPSTALATDADVERDSAWRGANAYVKAMTDHPDRHGGQEAIRYLWRPDQPRPDRGKRGATQSHPRSQGAEHRENAALIAHPMDHQP